jgi:uncharacterized membrane protein YphA (DoxX/SURF4 family)
LVDHFVLAIHPVVAAPAIRFVANRFWAFPQPERFMVENAFFEHLGLVGVFLLVAWYDLQQRYAKLTGDANARAITRA